MVSTQPNEQTGHIGTKNDYFTYYKYLEYWYLFNDSRARMLQGQFIHVVC